MKNKINFIPATRSKLILGIVAMSLSYGINLKAQGPCPGSSDCGSSPATCLIDLDGFSCNNLGGGGKLCNPWCSTLAWNGNAQTWWAFIAPGGDVTITLSTGTCIDADGDGDQDGLMWGIWADCTCGKEVYCCGPKQHPDQKNKTWTYKGTLEPCKKYYLWMTSVENDICDFTINVTLDNFIVQQRIGKPRTVCAGAVWNGQIISTPGRYVQRFPNNCCPFDSIVDFSIPPDPVPAEVYYITCDNTPYVDILKHSHKPCLDHVLVPLTKTTDPWKCDSSIILTAINIDVTPRWKAQCIGGMIEISPNISVLKPCSVGESYQFNYKWYLKNDPLRTTISTDERLLVESVSKDYCVEVSIRVDLSTESEVCTRTFCEPIKESDYAPKCFPMAGDLVICAGQTGSYWIDTVISQKVLFHTWTIDGGTVISKIDSPGVKVKWNLLPGDTGTVCVFYDTDCGRSCEKCLRVAMKASPAPDAGPNDSICDLVNQFQGKKDVGGSWTILSGPSGGNATISDNNDPKSKVSVDKFGMYRFAYKETYLGCSGSDTVDLFFNSKPDSSGLNFLCNSKQTQYNLQFKINGGTPPYKIIKGNGTIDANNVYNSNLYDNVTNYSILVRDAMGCELSFDFDHDCKCPNAIGRIDRTIEEMCEDQSFTCNYDPALQKLNPGDTIIYVITTNPDPDLAAKGNFIKMLNSATVIFDPGYMSYNTSYYIIVLIGKKNGKAGIDYQAGCVQSDGPKPFQFYQNPVPNAGPDNAICGTSLSLNGLAGIKGSKIKWNLISGSGITIADDTMASTTLNSNGQYGTFIFELSENNKGCIAADRVTISFNPSPFIAVDEKICLDYLPPFPYKANILITNGKPPFSIVLGNGTINGNIYSTDTLPSLAQFNVKIKDANGCISNLILDGYNCNCGIIDAGKLDTALVEVCVDQCVSIRSIVPETLAQEDVAMYVLHQSSYNDKIILPIDTFYSSSAKICFNPSKGMIPGKTYYITRVVGNDSMPKNAIVDNTDPCLRASNNQAIVWNAYPVPVAGAGDSVCFFDYQLKGIAKSGSASWKLISGPGQSTIANPNSAITNVSVAATGTYMYQLAENYKGCISYDTVLITHWDAPVFINAIPPECDNTAEYYRIKVDGQNGDRPSWVIDGYTPARGVLSGMFSSANTWQTDWIANNDNYRLIIHDRHNCLPDTISGTYECPCINSIGNLDKTPMILCLDDVARANYSVNSGNPDANDVIRYLLYEGNPADPGSGNQISYNNSGSFSFDKSFMQSGKTYYIAVLMGNPDPNDPTRILFSDRCLKFEVVAVTWYDYPLAKITGDDTLTCIETSIVLDGSTSVSGSGSPLTYNWTSVNGIIAGSNTTKAVTIKAPGTYKLLVTDPVSKCTSQTTYDIGIRVDNPVVAIAQPLELNCNRTSVMLDGSTSSQGAEFIVQWKGPGSIVNGNTYTPTVNATGVYNLIIANQKNGCSDSISINVIGDYQKPVPDIQQIGQLVCTNRQIQLDGSASKGQSGPIESYSWQTSNGNIISGIHSSTITIDKPGTYQLRVKDQNNGCDSLTTYSVLELSNPIVGIDLIAVDPKCFGDQNGEIRLNGAIANIPVDGIQYSINDLGFSKSSFFPNLSQGKYHLKIKDSNGCEHDTTVLLQEPSKLGIQVIKSIVVDLDSPVNLDSMILKISGGTPVYKDTSWLNLNQNISWPDVRYLADTTRDFLITVIDATGCLVQEKVTVIVRTIKDVWWPNVFSPNGDRINDFWNLKGKRINNIRTLNIYNRWGELVYSVQNIKDGNTDPNAGWDGEFNGKKVLPGVYVFYAEIEYSGSNGVDKFKGELTLVR